MDGTAEYEVDYTVTNTAEYPAEFTGCHAHGQDELFCVGSDGDEVQARAAAEEGEEEGHEGHGHAEGEEPAGEENCHFHAGVE